MEPLLGTSLREYDSYAWGWIIDGNVGSIKEMADE